MAPMAPSAAPVVPTLPPGVTASDPLARTHHGVFLRLSLGPAGFDTETTIGTDKYSVSGGGGGFGLAVGYAVTRSLIVYGEVFDDVAVGPTVKMNDTTISTMGQDYSAGVVGFGPGVAYYFPSNFFVGGTLAVSRLTVQQNNQEVAHSGNGFGVSGMVGREWWVSENWGLGLAAQLYVGSIPDNGGSSGSSTTWTTAGAMLGFSATYN
jgi:hypothetical protein